MGGDVAGVWEVDAVATHLGHDVLAEQDDLLGMVMRNNELEVKTLRRLRSMNEVKFCILLLTIFSYDISEIHNLTELALFYVNW